MSSSTYHDATSAEFVPTIDMGTYSIARRSHNNTGTIDCEDNIDPIDYELLDDQIVVQHFGKNLQKNRCISLKNLRAWLNSQDRDVDPVHGGALPPEVAWIARNMDSSPENMTKALARVFTSPMGLTPKYTQFLNEDPLLPDIVFDIIYNPTVTAFRLNPEVIAPENNPSGSPERIVTHAIVPYVQLQAKRAYRKLANRYCRDVFASLFSKNLNWDAVYANKDKLYTRFPELNMVFEEARVLEKVKEWLSTLDMDKDWKDAILAHINTL